MVKFYLYWSSCIPIVTCYGERACRDREFTSAAKRLPVRMIMFLITRYRSNLSLSICHNYRIDRLHTNLKLHFYENDDILMIQMGGFSGAIRVCYV